MISALYRLTAEQTDSLSALCSSPQAPQEQMEKLTKEVVQIRKLLEQAGKQNEQRFSLKLRMPHLSPALLWLFPVLLLLRVVWCAWAALWNGISLLLS